MNSDMNLSHSVIRLRPAIQHYDWGGYRFIPELLGIENPTQRPYAELWLGAHHRGPAIVYTATTTQPLDEWIARDPERILGQEIARRFQQRLPYLFKVLDVRKMLSIQIHPAKQAAEAGFQREQAAGIPLSAPHRNYKDDNHKPELMVALSDFWLLHGFKSSATIARTLRSVPELHKLADKFEDKGTRSLYQYVMELPQIEIDAMLTPLAERLAAEQQAGKLIRDQADYWAAQACRDYRQNGHYDRGIISIYLFNLVRLKPGEGMFQGAGIPHAYLEGVNVELMANSDNVLRGGLTPKHVDVRELLKHLAFQAVEPRILSAEALPDGQNRYQTPVSDFELSRIELPAGGACVDAAPDSPSIYLILSGEVKVDEQKFRRGESFFSPAGHSPRLIAQEASLLFRAGVPV